MSSNPSPVVRRQARAIRMLNCLQSGPAFNAKQLARLLEVSRRTIYRDLRLIREAGVTVVFEEETNGYRVQPSFPGDIAPPVLSAGDLMKLVIAAQFSPLIRFPQFGESVKESLARFLGCYPPHIRGPITRLLNNCRFELPAPQLPERGKDFLEMLLEAIGNRRQLRAVLRSEYPGPQTTTISPYRLEVQLSQWLVIGRSSAHRDVRSFEVDDFRDLVLTKQRYRIPRGATARPAEPQHPAPQHPASQHPASQHPASQHPASQHPASQRPAGPQRSPSPERRGSPQRRAS